MDGRNTGPVIHSLRVAKRIVTVVVSPGQRAAVREAFHRAGYDEELQVLPPDSGEELVFVLPQADLLRLNDVRAVEQAVQRLLDRKVWVVSSIGDATVTFE